MRPLLAALVLLGACSKAEPAPESCPDLVATIEAMKAEPASDKLSERAEHDRRLQEYRHQFYTQC